MGRVLVVTGGGRGIGAATAVAAARRGYDVAVGDRRRADTAGGGVAQWRSHGVRSLAFAADVSVEAEVEALFGAVDERLGPVWALVNNAGIVDRQSRLVDLTAARIERILRANTLSAFLCAREAVRRMSTATGGA